MCEVGDKIIIGVTTVTRLIIHPLVTLAIA